MSERARRDSREWHIENDKDGNAAFWMSLELLREAEDEIDSLYKRLEQMKQHEKRFYELLYGGELDG